MLFWFIQLVVVMIVVLLVIVGAVRWIVKIATSHKRKDD